MLSFKEYTRIDANEIIDEVLQYEWILKSNQIWKCVDSSENIIEIHHDGGDWYIHENTFSPKVFAHLCKHFIREVNPQQLLFNNQVIYSS